MNISSKNTKLSSYIAKGLFLVIYCLILQSIIEFTYMFTKLEFQRHSPLNIGSSVGLILSMIVAILGFKLFIRLTDKYDIINKEIYGTKYETLHDFLFKVILKNIVIIFLALSAWTMFGVSFLKTLGGVSNNQKTLQALASDTSGKLFLVLLALIIAPMLEEMIFRVAFIPINKKLKQTWPTILISSLLFGYLHMYSATLSAQSIIQFGTYFILGLCLALLYQRDNSYIENVTVHSCYNLIGVIALLF